MCLANYSNHSLRIYGIIIQEIFLKAHVEYLTLYKGSRGGKITSHKTFYGATISDYENLSKISYDKLLTSQLFFFWNLRQHSKQQVWHLSVAILFTLESLYLPIQTILQNPWVSVLTGLCKGPYFQPTKTLRDTIPMQSNLNSLKVSLNPLNYISIAYVWLKL